MKIKELEVNSIYTIPLVVTAANARETKNKKPYLSLELFDGIDSIPGNFWDWRGKNIPSNNTVLNVCAQVTEWQGSKQLNIRSIATNTELCIADFTPSSGVDVGDIYKQAYGLMGTIQDDFLRSLTLGVLEELRERWATVPAAVSVHHNYLAGTLIHSLSVARIAAAIAGTVDGANYELALAGGFLHDIGKLYGYRLNGIICEMTDEGMLYEHTFIGAEFVGNYAEQYLVKLVSDELKLEMLRHIILSHHGKLEYGAAVFPASIEAHIVSLADGLDSSVEQIRVASAKAPGKKWTDRIWACNNRAHLTTTYVSAVMSGTE